MDFENEEKVLGRPKNPFKRQVGLCPDPTFETLWKRATRITEYTKAYRKELETIEHDAAEDVAVVSKKCVNYRQKFYRARKRYYDNLSEYQFHEQNEDWKEYKVAGAELDKSLKECLYCSYAIDSLYTFGLGNIENQNPELKLYFD